MIYLLTAFVSPGKTSAFFQDFFSAAHAMSLEKRFINGVLPLPLSSARLELYGHAARVWKAVFAGRLIVSVGEVGT